MVTALYFGKQFSQRYRQCHGYTLQHVDGGVLLTALHAPEVGAIHARIKCQAFLGHPLRDADTAYVPPDENSPLHGRDDLIVSRGVV